MLTTVANVGGEAGSIAACLGVPEAKRSDLRGNVMRKRVPKDHEHIRSDAMMIHVQ